MTTLPSISSEPIPNELQCARTSSTACFILLAGQFLGVSFYLLSTIFEADTFVCIAIVLYAISVALALARNPEDTAAEHPPAADKA